MEKDLSKVNGKTQIGIYQDVELECFQLGEMVKIGR
jgi:hypothetical protein